MSLTYILIDFENVKPTAVDLKLIRGAGYRVLLFHGPHQNKFDADIVKALLSSGIQVELIQSERAGKNALDFHIAFYLGCLVEESKTADSPSTDKSRFVVVSKDGGFDVLLDHIETLGYGAMRAESVHQALVPEKRKGAAVAKEPAVKTLKPAKQKAASDTLQTLLDYLADHPKNRPAKIETLENHIPNIFGGAVSDQDKAALIAELVAKGFAKVTGKKVEYNLKNR